MSPQIRQLQLYRYLFWLSFIGLLEDSRETGSAGTGVKKLLPPMPCIPGFHPFFPGFPPLALFRLRNIKHCVISPASRLFRTSSFRPLFSPASCATYAHPPLFSRAPPPISSPQMSFGVLPSRCKEDHYLISIKQIFVSRIFLCPVINQVNRSFRIEREAARVKSYVEKNELSEICDTVRNFFNIAKQYGLFELFPFCLLSL